MRSRKVVCYNSTSTTFPATDRNLNFYAGMFARLLRSFSGWYVTYPLLWWLHHYVWFICRIGKSMWRDELIFNSWRTREMVNVVFLLCVMRIKNSIGIDGYKNIETINSTFPVIAENSRLGLRHHVLKVPRAVQAPAWPHHFCPYIIIDLGFCG